MARPKGSPKLGGRQKGTPNKATASIRDIAREYTTEAVDALVSVLRTGPAVARVTAAREILDRGYGKATQPIAGDDSLDPISTVTKIILTAPGYDDGKD